MKHAPIHSSPKIKKNRHNTNLQFKVTCTNKMRKRKKFGSTPPPPPPFPTLMWPKKFNVAKIFLTLIDQHFPKDKRLSKTFNRKTIKVRYSCLPNVKQTISNNSNRVLQLHRMKESTQDSKLCHCRQKKTTNKQTKKQQLMPT